MNPRSLIKYRTLYCAAILVVVTASAAGQAGKLDKTFGNVGIATQQTIVNGTTNFYAVGAAALQSDGKIVVVGGVPGNNDFIVPAVLRFQTNGALDKSLASNGVFVLPNRFGSYGAIAIQPDGKILAGTSSSGPTASGCEPHLLESTHAIADASSGC
jgi:hypothetical protein